MLHLAPIFWGGGGSWTFWGGGAFTPQIPLIEPFLPYLGPFQYSVLGEKERSF